MINTGDDLDKLEPIVASLLTVMAEYACDNLSKVSAKLYGSSRELEGGDVTVPGGLSDFIRRLDGRLKENTVRLEEEVVGIQWNDGGCSITTRAGSTLHCQHAIVTLPLGVLQVGMPFKPTMQFSCNHTTST